MPVEKSAGAIIFRKEGDRIYYLLLRYPTSSRSSKDYWDLPKGHVEKGEELEDTVKREVEEETGLKDLKIIGGFKETIRYFFKFEGQNILKFVTFFLAVSDKKEIKISGEHLGYRWLPYEEALEQLTYKNAKEILQKANEFISRKGL